MLNEIQQIHKLIEDSKQILITFRQDAKGDGIASALALFLFLKSEGKRVDMVCDGFELPKQLKFLKNSSKIKNAFDHLQKFIITIDTKDTGVEELSYDMKDEKLRVFITPKESFLTKDNVRTAQSDFKYDLIFVIDSPDLESLGALYDNNTELFYKTPIVNIDHKAGNEHFGQINITDITKTSTAEVLYNTLRKLAEENITEDVATALLTGMIVNTRSFKTDNVKPQTLATASKLISLGANRDYIVQNLYRTRSISALKLWGTALTHLQSDNQTGLVWTTITRDDFVRANATEHDLYDIIDELISNSPEAKITLLVHEHYKKDSNFIHVIARAEKGYNLKEMLKPFNPQGSATQVSLKIEKASLKEIENKIVEHLKKNLVK